MVHCLPGSQNWRVLALSGSQIYMEYILTADGISAVRCEGSEHG